MPGVAFNFTVLDRAVAALAGGDAADRAKATLIEANRPFAYLGALGPDLLQFTPVPPTLLQGWRELRARLEEEGFANLDEADRQAALMLHRRALMLAYGELLAEIQVQWPLLARVHGLLDELEQIAADEDLSRLRDRRDELEELSGLVEEGAGFDIQARLAEIEALIILYRPNLQTAPDPADPIATLQTLPVMWREWEFLRWRRSGQLARRLIETAATDQERAYAYGWMAHTAAAVTAEPFINAIVGGPYRTHWWRNRLIRNYVDCWAYGFYGAGATFEADEPTPAYPEWPNLCSARLHERIDLGLGIDGMGALAAVIGHDAEGGAVPMPTNAALDGLAQFIATAVADTHPTSTTALGPYRLDFGPAVFREAYVGAFAVLWLQTSGEGAACVPEFDRSPPAHCTGNPPDWVEDGGSPPKPSKHKRSLAVTILLAILAFLFLFSGGLSAGLAALGGAIGAGLHASKTFWNEVRCMLYWSQYMLWQMENEVLEFLRVSTLGFPMTRHLAMADPEDELTHPATDESGAAYCKTSDFLDPDYPRGMDGQGPAAGLEPDTGYLAYPSGFPEMPLQAIWPGFGAGRYPDFALEGAGGSWGLLNGGMMAEAPFPFRAAADGGPAFFGNAVDNAVQVIRAEADGLPDYNLDADRGYGWLAWRPPPSTFPAQPPIDVQPAT